MNRYFASCLAGAGLAVSTPAALAAANPAVPFYGSAGSITATPHYPIVGESTHIEVKVGNPGDTPATNVRVKISFNDWGVTFNGWQEIATVTVPGPIAPGGQATAAVDHVFQSRTHTCVEALIVGADENSDPNDDRGQINLEVINAGETFSYGVPVRNNGDQPLQLVIQGHCVRKEAAGAAGDLCRGVDLKAVVEPGKEVLVPVEINLAGIPLGETVDYVVDAFDAAGNHNHVVLRLVHETPKRLKEQALALAKGLELDLPSRPIRNRLETVRRHIDRALEDRHWENDRHVRHQGGAKVYAQELAAVNQLRDLLDTPLSAATKATLNTILLKLVDADRMLAQAALEGVTGEDRTEVLESLDDGDAARIKGRYAEAVQAYFQAWRAARD